MRVLHVVPFFHPAYVYGGPVPVIYELCRHLAADCDVRVVTTDANGPARLPVATDRDVRIGGFTARYCKRVAATALAPSLAAHLLSAVAWADVVHLSMVYSFPTFPALAACRLLRKPLVWSPMGALVPWPRRRTLKACWRRLCRALAPANLILHATSEDEAAGIGNCFPGVPVAVIPHGVEIPDGIAGRTRTGTLRLLFLGRLHPIKAVENLLEACARVRECSLVIAGKGEPPYAALLESRIAELGLGGRVRLAGQVEGERKEALFRNADVLVMPSHSENFSMSVAEALARGVPVIASRGTPWRRLEEIGCGLWVDNAPASLASAIERIRRMDLEAMGLRGRAWIEGEFRWDLIAGRTLALYRSRIPARAAAAGSPAVGVS